MEYNEVQKQGQVLSIVSQYGAILIQGEIYYGRKRNTDWQNTKQSV